MKIMSASFFIAFGLAIGTALSTLSATVPAAPHMAPDAATKDYAQVVAHDATTALEDARR